MTTRTTTSRRTRRHAKFAPAAWQWDPMSVTDAGIPIQVWSENGNLRATVAPAEARDMVRSGGYFAGSAIHICQVHDGIDGCNHPARRA